MTVLLSGGPVLEPAGRMAPYLQVAQLLRQAIIDGTFRVNESLPGEETMAKTYGVSRDTVRNALGVLREEGLVMTRRGAPSIVRSAPSKITIHAGPGDTVTSRLPTPVERQALSLPEGVWVISVRRPGSAEPELYDASRAEIDIRP